MEAAAIFTTRPMVGNSASFTSEAPGDVVLDLLLEIPCTLSAIVLQPVVVPAGRAPPASLSVDAGPNLDTMEACCRGICLPEVGAEGEF